MQTAAPVMADLIWLQPFKDAALCLLNTGRPIRKEAAPKEPTDGDEAQGHAGA